MSYTIQQQGTVNFSDEVKQNYPTLKISQRYLDCCYIQYTNTF